MSCRNVDPSIRREILRKKNVAGIREALTTEIPHRQTDEDAGYDTDNSRAKDQQVKNSSFFVPKDKCPENDQTFAGVLDGQEREP